MLFCQFNSPPQLFAVILRYSRLTVLYAQALEPTSGLGSGTIGEAPGQDFTLYRTSKKRVLVENASFLERPMEFLFSFLSQSLRHSGRTEKFKWIGYDDEIFVLCLC